jgi:hypothetical protein
VHDGVDSIFFAFILFRQYESFHELFPRVCLLRAFEAERVPDMLGFALSQLALHECKRVSLANLDLLQVTEANQVLVRGRLIEEHIKALFGAGISYIAVHQKHHLPF